MVDFHEFRKMYIEKLTEFRNNHTDYKGIDRSVSEETVVERMLNAIYRDKGRSDWLSHNPALKSAAKTIGITKSADFREYVWTNYVEAVSSDD